jgi:hypothetical protein
MGSVMLQFFTLKFSFDAGLGNGLAAGFSEGIYAPATFQRLKTLIQMRTQKRDHPFFQRHGWLTGKFTVTKQEDGEGGTEIASEEGYTIFRDKQSPGGGGEELEGARERQAYEARGEEEGRRHAEKGGYRGLRRLTGRYQGTTP